MSYAVVRMAKMKSHDLKGMQFHNQREKESKTNPDIDKSKSSLNYDLHNSGPIDYNKRVKEIINSQKVSERKTRKDAVLVNELLVTSDRHFFDKLSPEDEKRFFHESYKLFSERYGPQNIAYATVHKDEKTPHLHLGVVPMKEGRLQGKNVFNRQELLWIQNDFPKHMKDLGFDIERGEKGSDREHIEMQKFKAQTLDKKVKELESSLNDVQQAYEIIQKVDEVEVKEKKDMKSLVGLKGHSRVEMASEDFERIQTLARSSEGLKMQNRQFESENGKLKSENIAYRKQLKQMAAENRKLREDNTHLRNAVVGYKELTENLKQTLELVKNSSVKHLQIGLERMRSFVGEARLHVLFGKLGKEAFSKEVLEKMIPANERAGAAVYMGKVEKREREEMEKKDREKERSADAGKPAKKARDNFEMER